MAVISIILCMPFIILFSLLVLHIEPDFGPLQPYLANSYPDEPTVFGSVIALGTVLLVLIAFLLYLILIVRTRRAGGGLKAHPVSLILAVITLSAILFISGAIVVDQFPCWIGVPNGD
ncbi:MAG: hypothetical protein C0391_05600 [Anaerolinea sp.]|nr:hypothetical protein [Anaerolinea sp.]